MSFVRDTLMIFRRQERLALRNPAWVIIGLTQPILYLALFGPLLTKLPAATLGTTGNAYKFFVPGLLIQLGLFGSTFVGFAWQLAKPTTARPAIASPATSWRHVHRVRLDPILTSVTGHDSAPRAHLWPQHVPCAPGPWNPGRRVVCPPAVTGARPRGSSQAAWRPYRRTTPGRWRSAAGQLPSRARRCPRSYGANGCRSLYMTGCN